MCRTLSQSHKSRMPVRRSASNVLPHRRQLREPTASRLSPHTMHGPGPATRRGRLSWENELLQMQIASSALIKPLGNAESASIADPRIIAEVTHQVEESSCLTASARSQSVAQAAQEQQMEAAESLLQEWVTANSPSQRSPDETLLAQNARSMTSPFFAAAQRFALQTDSAVSKAPPPPLFVPNDDDPQAIEVGLALQKQTESAEVVIPSASFTSLASPTLREHPLTVLPLSPQTTAKGFLTADSFKHEPGTTLLDCTDPTPCQSVDLDDSRLKNRLAQLLPDFPFPPSKRVRRDLSNQLSSLSEGTDGGDDDAIRHQAGPSHHRPAPGPASAESTAACKAALNNAAHPSPRKSVSETAIVLDGECSQAGDTQLFVPLSQPYL